MEYTVKKKMSEKDFKKLYEDSDSSRRFGFYLDVVTAVLFYSMALVMAVLAICFRLKIHYVSFILILAIAVLKTRSLLKRNDAAGKWASVYYKSVLGDSMPETEMTFCEDKIILRNEIEEYILRPEDIYSFYFGDDALHFYQAKALPFSVLKDDFESGEKWAEFYSFAKAHYSKCRRVHFKKPVCKKDWILAILLGLFTSAAIWLCIFLKATSR